MNKRKFFAMLDSVFVLPFLPERKYAVDMDKMVGDCMEDTIELIPLDTPSNDSDYTDYKAYVDEFDRRCAMSFEIKFDSEKF